MTRKRTQKEHRYSVISLKLCKSPKRKGAYILVIRNLGLEEPKVASG